MATETRRGLVRIGSNYARLLLAVGMGLVTIPLLIRGVGVEAYGLYVLLGATVGLAQLSREIVQRSMNRELGHAFHSPDPSSFPPIYNAAIVLSAGLAAASALIFVVLLLIVPFLRVPEHLQGAARWIILAGGVNTFFIVLLAPQFNMYMITERPVAHNVRTLLDRASLLLAAVAVFLVLGMREPAVHRFDPESDRSSEAALVLADADNRLAAVQPGDRVRVGSQPGAGVEILSVAPFPPDAIALTLGAPLEGLPRGGAELVIGRPGARPGAALIAFGVGSTLLSLLVLLFAVAHIVWLEPRLRPSPSRVSRVGLRRLLGTSAWNLTTIMAINMHTRVDQVLVNIFAGVTGNAAFGLAVTLTNYVRMLTVGLTEGLDSAAARLSANDRQQAMSRLRAYTTRLSAWIAAPAAVTLFVLAEPLMHIWVGSRNPDAAPHAALAAVVARAMTIGILARTLTDALTTFLYGAGFVRRYAKVYVVGGLVGPLLSALLLWLAPENIKVVMPAVVFSAIFAVGYLVALPIIGGRCLGLPARTLLRPALRPLVLAIGCAPVLMAAWWLVARTGASWNPLTVALSGGAYGALYLALTPLVVVRGADWDLLKRLIRARAGAPSPNEQTGCGTGRDDPLPRPVTSAGATSCAAGTSSRA